MAIRYSRYIPAINLVGDYLLLNFVFVLGFLFSTDISLISANHLLFFIYLNVIWLVLVVLFGAYQFKRNTEKKELLKAYIKIIVFFFFFFLLFFQLKPLNYYPRDFLDFVFPFYTILILIWKLSLHYFFLYIRNKGYNFRRAIIIGNSQDSRALYSYLLNNKWYGYRCFGFVGEKNHETSPYLGNIEELHKILKAKNIDEVFLDLTSLPENVKNELYKVLNKFPVSIKLVPQFGLFGHKYFELTKYGHIPVIEVNPGPLSYWYNKLIKRITDMGISLVICVAVLSWLIPLILLMNIMFDRKGVFFTQKRTSINGREFKIIKFRSMKINDIQDQKKAKEKDERITTLGHFLRKTSIDELPQFINVLLGQMSVVGPRPHMLKHTELYNNVVEKFMVRHSVKPGITGLAQVSGYRGEVKKLSDIRKRVEMDVQYIENWTINLDLKIILKTMWLLIKGQEEAR